MDTPTIALSDGLPDGWVTGQRPRPPSGECSGKGNSGRRRPHRIHHRGPCAAIAGVEVTALLGAVNVVATYFGFRWIDKIGRRPLALGGYAGMTASILLAALGVAFMTPVPKTVVALVASPSLSPPSRSVSAVRAS